MVKPVQSSWLPYVGGVSKMSCNSETRLADPLTRKIPRVLVAVVSVGGQRYVRRLLLSFLRGTLAWKIYLVLSAASRISKQWLGCSLDTSSFHWQCS